MLLAKVGFRESICSSVFLREEFSSRPAATIPPIAPQPTIKMRSGRSAITNALGCCVTMPFVSRWLHLSRRGPFLSGRIHRGSSRVISNCIRVSLRNACTVTEVPMYRSPRRLCSDAWLTCRPSMAMMMSPAERPHCCAAPLEGSFYLGTTA